MLTINVVTLFPEALAPYLGGEHPGAGGGGGEGELPAGAVA